MKFLFNKAEMVEAVSIAQEVVSIKSISSILSNILIKTGENKVFIKATDTKINYEAQVSAQIFEPGSAIIYCIKFMGILNSFSQNEEIEFFQEENTEENTEMKIDSQSNIVIKPIEGKINFQIKSTYYKQFPEFCMEENIFYFEISSKDFKEMTAQTSFAVSVEEARYFLNGVFFEKEGNKLNLVATDGRRLSFIHKMILLEMKIFFSAIIHPKILNILSKYLPDEENIFISIIEKKAFFKFGGYKFDVKLLEGQFPNYVRVIPKKQDFVFCVKKADLENALCKHISLMLDKKIGRIYFSISPSVLNIMSLHPEVGSVDEEIPCEYTGESKTIAFYFNYMEDPLKVIKSKMVAFEFTEEMKAVTMRSEPPQGYFHIIMPMQKE